MFTIKNTNGQWYQGENKYFSWGPKQTRAKYDIAQTLPGSIPESTAVVATGPSQTSHELIPTLMLMVSGDTLQYEDLENPATAIAHVVCDEN